MTESSWNWAGNYQYQAARLHRPQSVEELQQIVAQASKLRALGSRHSFNSIADTPADLVSMEQFNQVLGFDHSSQTVTVEAGIKYGHLCHALDAAGYALHNLASLPHISVAGTCATATHGSGNQNGNLATAVVALELVTAQGELLHLSREQNPQQFAGAVVNLGSLGIVTKLRLQLLPTFSMRQYVYENLELAQLAQHFDAVTSLGYSVSLFTDWQAERFNQVWVKQKVVAGETAEAPNEVFGATLAPAQRHPIGELSGINCTEQMGVPGPWYERLPHFRMDFTPSSGEELQSEYFVPRHQALAGLEALSRLREQIAPLLLISEVRTIAADDLWMSPAYKQDVVAFHFTWKQNWPAVQALLPQIEAALLPFGVLPHWGKLFTLSADYLQGAYPRLADFRGLLEQYDPAGKLRNPFVESYIFGA